MGHSPKQHPDLSPGCVIQTQSDCSTIIRVEVQGFLCLQVQRVQRQHQIDGGEDDGSQDQTSTSSFRDEMLTQRKRSRLNQDSSKFVISFEGCLLYCLIYLLLEQSSPQALHNQPQKCYECSSSPVVLFSSLFSSVIRLSLHHPFKFLDFIEPCRRTTDGWSKKTFGVDHLQKNINTKLLKFKLKTKGHVKALRPEVRSLVTTGFG